MIHFPDSFRRALVNDNLVIVIGAGISKATMGLPDWKELIEGKFIPILQKRGVVEEDLNADGQYLNLAELCKSKMKEEYEKTVTGCYSINVESVISTDFYEPIASLKPRAIVTTNYDKLIEIGLSQLNIGFHTIISDKDFQAWNQSDQLIIKIHGDIEQPDTWVLSSQDYAEFRMRNPLIYQYLISLYLNSTVIYCGFSLADPNFEYLHRYLLKHLNDSEDGYSFMRRNYLFNSSKSMYYRNFLESLNVELINIDNHVDLLHALRQCHMASLLRKDLTRIDTYGPCLLDGVNDGFSLQNRILSNLNEFNIRFIFSPESNFGGRVIFGLYDYNSISKLLVVTDESEGLPKLCVKVRSYENMS